MPDEGLATQEWPWWRWSLLRCAALGEYEIPRITQWFRRDGLYYICIGINRAEMTCTVVTYDFKMVCISPVTPL